MKYALDPRLLPPGVPHQGVALLADPPEPAPLEALAAEPSGVLVLLDQVTDPQNVGSIFRSAAAFAAKCGGSVKRSAWMTER